MNILIFSFKIFVDLDVYRNFDIDNGDGSDGNSEEIPGETIPFSMFEELNPAYTLKLQRKNCIIFVKKFNKVWMG